MRGLEETDEELRGLRTGPQHDETQQKGSGGNRAGRNVPRPGPKAAPPSPVDRAATRN